MILFKQKGVKLRLFSRVQMFADSEMSKLLWQTEGGESMWEEDNYDPMARKPEVYHPPQVLNSSSVWMCYDKAPEVYASCERIRKSNMGLKLDPAPQNVS